MQLGSERRVALVTGAARGIGLGVSAWLLAEGWSVVLADVDHQRGRKVAKALGAQAWFLAMDVADEEQVEAGVVSVLARYGRLDALVCSAAVSDPYNEPVEVLAREHWDRVLAVNLTGTMLLVKHCAPYLRALQGAVVTLSSTRAHQSEANCEAYAASKGALVALTHSLAVSLGPDVRVNCVSPGWVDSRDRHEIGQQPLSRDDHAQHPVGRAGQVEDVAALVAWLIGEQSGFVTGQEFVLDGGMSRKMIYQP